MVRSTINTCSMTEKEAHDIFLGKLRKKSPIMVLSELVRKIISFRSPSTKDPWSLKSSALDIVLRISTRIIYVISVISVRKICGSKIWAFLVTISLEMHYSYQVIRFLDYLFFFRIPFFICNASIIARVSKNFAVVKFIGNYLKLTTDHV